MKYKKDPMTMLITGSSGVLGRELAKLFPNSLQPSHSELDLRDRNQVFKFFEKIKPDIVIHAAALTGIRECEDDKAKAWMTNVCGTEKLVDVMRKANPEVYFLYISTACVFDGHRGMYREEDIPYPENFYSLTKLIGEFVVRGGLSNHLIIRTNFVARKRWKYQRAFTDRFGTYLFAEDVAKAIKDAMEIRLSGVIHITGDKKMSMFELAQRTTPDIKSMTIADYSGPRLTMDMSLDTSRWKKYKLS